MCKSKCTKCTNPKCRYRHVCCYGDKLMGCFQNCQCADVVTEVTRMPRCLYEREQAQKRQVEFTTAAWGPS